MRCQSSIFVQEDKLITLLYSLCLSERKKLQKFYVNIEYPIMTHNYFSTNFCLAHNKEKGDIGKNKSLAAMLFFPLLRLFQFFSHQVLTVHRPLDMWSKMTGLEQVFCGFLVRLLKFCVDGCIWQKSMSSKAILQKCKEGKDI